MQYLNNKTLYINNDVKFANNHDGWYSNFERRLIMVEGVNGAKKQVPLNQDSTNVKKRCYY